ncbi:MAG: hypothetical protein KDI79_24675 [Anaerolineae bacterium]|nr:hypothetical protein [Anaerolineae bacterium]
MKTFFKSIWDDLKQLKNLELYVVLTATIAIFTADIVGVQTTSVLFNIVLAALAVLIYGMITDRHTSERIERKIEFLSQIRSGSEFFSEWSPDALKNLIIDAEEVCNLSAANYEFIRDFSENFYIFLQRGGKLRLILVGPDSYSANLAVASAASNRKVENLKQRMILSMQQIKSLLEHTTDKSQIQIKVINYLPVSVITIVNPVALNSSIFVALNGFKIPGKKRPTFKLTKDDGNWFNFYLLTFENLWSWEESRPLDIEEINRIAHGVMLEE